jgi:hypothetical protein
MTTAADRSTPTPSERSKTTIVESRAETPRKSEEYIQETPSGAIPDVEKGGKINDAGQALPNRFLVEFDGPNDPGNPKNWTQKRRWAITIAMGLMVFTVTFASSIFSVNIGVITQIFDVNQVTATLGVALFVLVCSFQALESQKLTDESRDSVLALSPSDPCQKFSDAKPLSCLASRSSPFSRSRSHLLKTSQPSA